MTSRAPMIPARLLALLALAQRLLHWSLAAVLLYAGVTLLVAMAPGLFTATVGGSAALYLVSVGLALLLFRSFQALSRQEHLTEAALQVRENRQEVGVLRGENRLLDFKGRLLSRSTDLEATCKLEMEIDKREKKIEGLAQEGRLAELKHETTFAGLQSELEYYKREFNRQHQENRWLKSALRQNHIDLAYLKEHVEQFLAATRPSLVARVRSLFSLSTPSPTIVMLARSLEIRPSARGGSQGGHRVLPPALPSR